MKSPQIGSLPPDPEGYYSDLQVMRSGGGWYVGTMFRHNDGSFFEPGSRDSHYFENEEEATSFLRKIEKEEANGNLDHSQLRLSP